LSWQEQQKNLGLIEKLREINAGLTCPPKFSPART
jgi:hypothetical protein